MPLIRRGLDLGEEGVDGVDGGGWGEDSLDWIEARVALDWRL
jgi:hypothetical protein